MKNFIEILKNIILPTPMSNNRGVKSNASLIVEELVYVFKKSIERMSTERTLMFDSAFVAYIPKSYFTKIHPYFGYITAEVSERYNDILGGILKRDKHMKFAPLSDEWSFDLIPIPPKGEDTPDESNPEITVTSEELEEKFVAAFSFPVEKEKFNFSDLSDDEEVKTNQSQPNSKVRRMQVLKIEAIRGLKDNGIGFHHKIKVKRQEECVQTGRHEAKDKSQLILHVSGSPARFLRPDGEKCNEIKLNFAQFYIGGSSASYSYNGLNMIRLDAEEVLSPHLEIKKESDGSFFLMAIGPVLLDNAVMQKNKWTRLPDKKATVRLNGNIEVVISKK